MPKTYTQLTEDERYQIYESLAQGQSHQDIAQQLNRHHSTVSREVTRNRSSRGYRPQQAQRFANQRQHDKPKPIKLTTQMKILISHHIKKDWSPEQVQGRLRGEGLPVVCFTTIYAFIRRDKAAGGELIQTPALSKALQKKNGEN